MREHLALLAGVSALALIAVSAAPASATAQHPCPHGQHCTTSHPPRPVTPPGAVKSIHQTKDGGHVKA